MTLENAHKIADRLLGLPTLYDEPPSFTPPDTITTPFVSHISFPWANNEVRYSEEGTVKFYHDKAMYRPNGGFDDAYTGRITSWEYTTIANTDFSICQRYITLDDLRMMAYIGTEYAKAKLLGWRYRCVPIGPYATTNGPGSVVRNEDGQKCIMTSNNKLSPFIRKLGFGENQDSEILLPEDFNLPDITDSYSGLVSLGELTGHGGILKFGQSKNLKESDEEFDKGLIVDDFLTSGSVAIIMTTASTLDEEEAYSAPVVFSKHVYPFYLVRYADMFNDVTEPGAYVTTSIPNYKYAIRTYEVSQGSYVPVVNGTIYYLYALFSGVEVRADANNSICSVLKITTRTRAPKYQNLSVR